MMRCALLCAALLFPFAAAARPVDAGADRGADGVLQLHWTDADPVDVYAPDGRLVAHGAMGGVSLPASTPRSRFLLRDTRDGISVPIGKRLLNLAAGSNFRELGGYPAAGGKHIRWGLIWRSAATPLITPQDGAAIAGLGLRQMIDLRSSEERVLAPTRVAGVPYSAVGYSFTALTKAEGGPEAIYRKMPLLLAPQMRLIFAALLRHDVPIAYNCSAGQDRTGFATALVLTALGTPRETIYADYLLSTRYRHPEFEMPVIDPAQHPGDPVAQIFANYNRPGRKPGPLATAEGKPFLNWAFDEMDKGWGSPQAYMAKELGVGPAELAKLRKLYLE